MLGRLLLNPLNQWIGEQRVLYVYGVIALGLEFAIWFADSLVGNAIVCVFSSLSSPNSSELTPPVLSVGIIGVLMGPSYPIVRNEFASKSLSLLTFLRPFLLLLISSSASGPKSGLAVYTRQQSRL